LHLDLHPLNVMLTKKGPVVIDWTGAARGDPAADVALAWVLLSAGQPPAGPVMSMLVKAFRGILLKSFLASAGRDAARPLLRAVVDHKVKDPHMSETEVAAMWRLVEENEA
jgi:aminoglycoside phosphotransferase (APT) family kinase protein